MNRIVLCPACNTHFNPAVCGLRCPHPALPAAMPQRMGLVASLAYGTATGLYWGVMAVIGVALGAWLAMLLGYGT